MLARALLSKRLAAPLLAFVGLAALAATGFGQDAGLHFMEDASSIGLAGGETAPNFRLTDQAGRKRDIASLMREHGLVLVFFRSADWCIYCKGQLSQLQHDLPLLHQAGLGLAGISYDSPAVLKDFATRRGITFPLLSDHESTAIRAYRVMDRKYHEGSQVYDESAEIPVYGISYSAVFVLDRFRRVRWRFAAETEQLRLTGAAILERGTGLVTRATRSEVEGGKVQLQLTSSNASLGLGQRSILGVELKIPAGLHVYGPSIGKEYRGLEWRMESSSCATIGAADFPSPSLKQMAFDTNRLPIYEGTVRITRELIVPPSIRPDDNSVFASFRANCLTDGSKLAVGGVLQFQACDDAQCFPPLSLPVHWEFELTPPDRKRVPVELWRVFEVRDQP